MRLDTRTPSHTTNPGEAAYLAYWRGWPVPLALPWRQLTQHERRAWRQVAKVMARWSVRSQLDVLPRINTRDSQDRSLTPEAE